MLRRLTLGFLLLAGLAAAAACSTNTSTPSTGGVPGNGPNFGTNTLYVANTTTNSIDLFTPAPGPSTGPQYVITSTASNGLSGPQYLAFNSSKQLFVTNFNAATKASFISVFQEFATGNVLPFNAIAVPTNTIPRGIAFLPNGDFAFALVSTGQVITSELDVYTSQNTLAFNIAGSNTGLNAPTGVAADANNNVYVGNSGNASVTVYALPTPSPTPTGSPSPTPSPTPTPTPTPTGSPSATPSPTPTPTPFSTNIAPIVTLTSGLTTPTGIALDSKGNLYVADAGSSTVAPSIVIFNAPLKTGMAFTSKITSSAFVSPTDVKVDTSGTIYVVDAGSAPSTSKLLIFKAGSSTPVSVALPQGTSTGLGLSP